MSTQISKRCQTVGAHALCLAVVLLSGCVTIIQPPNGANTGSTVVSEVGFRSQVCVNTFRAELDGNVVTQQFSPQPPAATRPQATFSGLAAGSHTLTASAETLQYWFLFPYCGQGSDTVTFTVTGPPPPPIPPPSSVSSLTPTSGIVGILVSVGGAGFAASHAISFSNRSVATTFISSTELQFRVPQQPVGSHNVAVAGVGPQSFSLTAGTLSVSPSPISLLYGSNVTLSVTLPLAAPPGGVDLTVMATSAGIIQLAGQGRLNYSQGASNDTVLITPQDVGSATITISGDGYTTASIPFTVSLGTPQCGVRARAQGGVEFVNPPGSNNVVSSLPSTQAAGRIETAPGGARAVVQYLNGIAFVDLVNCTSLGSFQSSTIPLNNFAFSSNGRFFAADWFHATQNDGLVAYKLVDGSQLFSRNTTSNSLNVLIAGDSTGDFAFWVTSTNTPQGAQPQLSIHALSGAPASCFVGNVPSNNMTISMSGGVATIQFMGIFPQQTWRVQANNCNVLP